MERGADVSAIVVNYNGGEHLLNCLRSLAGQEGLLETIVVDNASADGSLTAALREFPDIVPLADTVNRGRAEAPNRGARLARGSIFVFLDHDVILEPGCIARLAEVLRRREAVVGPVLHNGPERIEQFGMTIDWLGYPLGLHAPGAPLFINGPVVGTTRALFERLRGFDGRFFYAAEDLDYGWRALLTGATVAIVPGAEADHLGGGGGTMPGGYGYKGRFETTEFRVAMRERHTLTVMLCCAPAASLPLLVPAYLAKLVVLSAVTVAMGHPTLALDLMRGIGWNARQLPATMRRRAATPRTREGAREARRRIQAQPHVISMLRRYGMPRFLASAPRRTA